MIVQIYVEDIIFGSTNNDLCKNFENSMKEESEMSIMGELNYSLGLKIKQRSDVIFVNQAKYTKELIEKSGLENVKVSKALMAAMSKLDEDDQDKCVDIKIYKGIIGSLLYLTASRLDIIFSVCVCVRFLSCPKEPHLSAIKRIIKYLKALLIWACGTEDWII